MKNEEYEPYNHLFPKLNQSLSFVQECNRCKEHRGHDFISRRIIWGNGNLNAKIIVVGKDSAGASINERLWKGSRLTSMPLTNKKTGAKLRVFLYKAGIDPFSVFITNIVKCNEGRDKLNISFTELSKSCIYYIIMEIEKIKPKIIITLGDAFKILNKIFNVTKIIDLPLLHRNEIIGESNPFLGELQSGIKIEIFNFKHPSYIEGIERERAYVNNLSLIAGRI